MTDTRWEWMRRLTAAGRAGRVMSALAMVGALAGCAGGPGPREPAPPGVLRGSLPPIPSVTGPLRLRVEYPDSNQLVLAADSNFIFGSTGSGDATLIIDGAFVDVEPNGSFLAWLPVPARTAGDTAVYRLTARRGSEADTLSHPVLLPRVPAQGPPGAAWIDSASVPRGVERWALPEEILELSMRASEGGQAWAEAGAARIPFAEVRPGRYSGRVTAAVLHAAACTADLCDWSDEAAPLVVWYAATSGTDTVKVPAEVLLRILDPQRLPVAQLQERPDTLSGNDGIVVGRPVPFGPYRWRFAEGTRAVVDGRSGDRVRLRLAPYLHAWVTDEEARILPGETPLPESEVGDLRFETRNDRVELRIDLDAALPLQLELRDSRTLILTLFRALGNTDRVAHGAGSRLVEEVSWTQLPGRRYRLTIRLAEPVWGYRATYPSLAPGRAELLLEIRRMPAIDRQNPLRGRRIAIDPGHPGAGAYGPTGFYEGDANLAIGRILERRLRERGAEPVLLRDDTLPMGLYERTVAAQEAGAEVFVSIHNNALPDGVRPFGREGTSTYYYHPHAARLAVAVQEGMLHTMRLRDLGVYWGDLAVCRMSWMPSILTEGAFMMMPAHEAALRTTEFQERYASGVLEGIEAFLAAASRVRGGAVQGR